MYKLKNRFVQLGLLDACKPYLKVERMYDFKSNFPTVPSCLPFGARLPSRRSLLNNMVLHMRPPRKEGSQQPKVLLTIARIT